MPVDQLNRRRMICGVDEAGRGPVLGPLVVGGVAVSDDGPLRRLGVRDSKLLTPKRREELEVKIKDNTEWELVFLEAEDLDALRSQMTLNRIEARLFASVLKALVVARLAGEADASRSAQLRVTAYLDAADSNAANYAREVNNRLAVATADAPLPPIEMVCEHKADTRYPVVAAASILAKVARDRAIARLAEQVDDDVGSGYPSDPVTQEFIKRYWRDNHQLPPGTRRTWKTVDRLLRPQASLDRFAD